VGRNEKMLVDGKAVPYAWNLVLDADAEPRDPMRRLARDIAAVEQDGARRWRQLSAEHLEERALAGAVGADEAAQLAAAQPEIDAGHRFYPAEVFGDTPSLEQRFARRPGTRRAVLERAAWSRGVAHRWRMPMLERPRRNVGNRPFGMTSTNKTSKAPRTRVV
jgi:hypothetical protein